MVINEAAIILISFISLSLIITFVKSQTSIIFLSIIASLLTILLFIVQIKEVKVLYWMVFISLSFLMAIFFTGSNKKLLQDTSPHNSLFIISSNSSVIKKYIYLAFISLAMIFFFLILAYLILNLGNIGPNLAKEVVDKISGNNILLESFSYVVLLILFLLCFLILI